MQLPQLANTGPLACEQIPLETLLPAGVASASAGDGAAPERLFPDEERATEHALERRRQEFALGRTCARSALMQLGVAPVSIPVRDRAPVWPAGIVGAITHTGGFVAAAVAREAEIAGLGIDAEARGQPLAARVERLICTPFELARASAEYADVPDVLRVLFSAKESVHKCVAPRSGVTLGFHDVEIDLDYISGTFSARLVGAAHPRLPRFERIEGRFVVTPAIVLTVAIIPSPADWCSGDATVSRRDNAMVG